MTERHWISCVCARRRRRRSSESLSCASLNRARALDALQGRKQQPDNSCGEVLLPQVSTNATDVDAEVSRSTGYGILCAAILVVDGVSSGRLAAPVSPSADLATLLSARILGAFEVMSDIENSVPGIFSNVIHAKNVQ